MGIVALVNDKLADNKDGYIPSWVHRYSISDQREDFVIPVVGDIISLADDAFYCEKIRERIGHTFIVVKRKIVLSRAEDARDDFTVKLYVDKYEEELEEDYEHPLDYYD